MRLHHWIFLLQFFFSQPLFAKCGDFLNGEASESTKYNYEEIFNQILKAKCFFCHGEDGRREGGVDISTYPALIKDLKRIEKAVFIDKIMPSGDFLTAQQYAKLRAWIDAGAPE